MDVYHSWAGPPYKPVNGGCGLPLAAGVLVLGVIGGSLGAAALTAYAIVQTPTIRQQFGPYFNLTASQDIDNIHRIGYTLEIIVVVLAGILGILSNALLIYGVIRSRRWYLVHWLVLHVLVVVAGLVATILILLLKSGLHKLYCLIPISVIVTIVFCWVKVYQLFCEMEVKIKMPSPCQLHPDRLGEPAWGGGWPGHGGTLGGLTGAGGGYVKEWMHSKDNGIEFYPVDKLSRTMQENTLYCGSESTVSSIVPTNDKNEYDYTTLPALQQQQQQGAGAVGQPNEECKVHPTINSSHRQEYRQYSVERNGYSTDTNSSRGRREVGQMSRYSVESNGNINTDRRPERTVSNGSKGSRDRSSRSASRVTDQLYAAHSNADTLYAGHTNAGFSNAGELRGSVRGQPADLYADLALTGGGRERSTYTSSKSGQQQPYPTTKSSADKLAIGGRHSQESRTDSNLTNAEI